MSNERKKSPPKATDFGGLYLPGDRIPTAEAVEADTESAWALFNELTVNQEARFAETAPGSLQHKAETDQRYADTQPAGLVPAGPAGTPQAQRVTVDSVMVEARRNNRVCPLPLQWQVMYDLLPTTVRPDGKRVPTPPLAGLAWHQTPSLSKRTCLREQVEWAATQGCLGTIQSFFGSLQEDEWHHMGD